MIRKAIVNFTTKALGLDESTYRSFVSGWGTETVDKLATYDLRADRGYSENPVVQKIVNEIACGGASIPLRVMRRPSMARNMTDRDEGDTAPEAVEDHAIGKLFDQPNPMQSGVEFLQAVFSYLLIDGNAFILRSESMDGLPHELTLLRPDRVEIIAGDTFIPKRYEYRVDGKVKMQYDVDPVSGESEVTHIRLFNPCDDWRGLSPLIAAAGGVRQYNEIEKHNINLLRNGARPSGALIHAPNDKNGPLIPLTDEQKETLKSDLTQTLSGTMNAGGIMLLEEGFDFKPMSISPKDMDYENLINQAVKSICLGLGVPHQIGGITEGTTYNNMQQARLIMLDHRIVPLAEMITSAINKWIVPAFMEDDLFVAFDYDEYPAMIEKRNQIYNNVSQGVKEGIISRNEAREALGRGHVEGGDELWIPMGLQPLSEDPADMPPPAPPPEPKPKPKKGDAK